MNVLIAGGCGFIGSNLCDYLIEKNYNVICVDNLSTSTIDNIKHLLDHENFQFMNHDIVNTLSFSEDVKIDEIYNLACPASPKDYQSDPIKTLKTNFIGTLNLLNLAKEKGSKFLLSSTSEVYGDPSITPQNEEYRGNVNTVGIRSCYDEGKRVAETLVNDYRLKYNINTKIARIFNTYGPRMKKNDGRVVSNFINQSLLGKALTIYGNGLQTRSFCYIDDTILGLIKLMNCNYNLPINIGNPNEMSILFLAKKIMYLLNQEDDLCFEELPSDDPLKRNPCIKKAQNILDWNPKINIDNGLQKTIDYYKSIL